MSETTSQNARILSALKEGRVLSPLGALKEFGCFRLAARISDLRKQGHQIASLNCVHNGKRYCSYYIKEAIQREFDLDWNKEESK